jgi:hypothetical protein
MLQPEHWDGKNWSSFPAEQHLDPADDADDVYAETSWLASSTDGMTWAVAGRYDPTGDRPVMPTIRRWIAPKQSWRFMPIPKLRRQYLFNSVSALTSDNAWAIAVTHSGTPLFASVIEHWDGRKWTVSPAEIPSDALLQDISASQKNAAWAVGERYLPNRDTPVPLMMHWDGKRWTPSAFPAKDGWLEADATVPSGDTWAVGKGLLAHFKPCSQPTK